MIILIEKTNTIELTACTAVSWPFSVLAGTCSLDGALQGPGNIAKCHPGKKKTVAMLTAEYRIFQDRILSYEKALFLSIKSGCRPHQLHSRTHQVHENWDLNISAAYFSSSFFPLTLCRSPSQNSRRFSNIASVLPTQ